jgi:sigma-B regulation protein RsbU (phosphoserine phosphatase)
VAGDIFSSDVFTEFLKWSMPITPAPGTVLVTQGTSSDVAYFLAAGEVTVFAETAYGSVPLSTLAAPRLIGEIGVLADLPRTATIRAGAGAVLHPIARDDLLDLGRRLPGLFVAVIGQLGRQIGAINNALGLYTNALEALERREFDPRILDDLRNPPPQIAGFATMFRRFAGQITEKRRQEDEMAGAAVIQRSLLPAEAERSRRRGHFDVAATIRPAREVGGDFFDLLQLDDRRLVLAVGDVCGKGLPASLFMSVTVTVLRTAAREYTEAADIVARVNGILCRDNPSGMFATAFFGILDVETGNLSYCNCGHNAPMLIGADGTPTLLPATGLPLGMFEDRSAAQRSIQIRAGETLVVFSDGITEAMNPSQEEFGEDRLAGLLARSAAFNSAGDLLDQMFAETDAFSGPAEQADDMTCIVVRGL